MKNPAHLLVVLTALVSTSAFAACEMPSLVATIPDGTTATEDQLLQVQLQIRDYVAAMDDYIACQNEELNMNGDTATSAYLHLMAERIDAARQEVDRIASEFNAQVAAFRSARQAAATGR
jgi:hypothetical protein